MSAVQSFLSLARVITAADDVKDAVVAIRDGIPDDEWEEIITAHPLVEALWCACVELEDVLERD
jgi:hypothetical protein